MIKAVIAGCGAIARKRHAPACRAYEGEKICLGFFDPVMKNAKALAEKFGGEVYDSLEAVLRDEEVDGVLVCTPEKFHCDTVVACLQAQKHVLCEKPMALDIGQAKRMAQAQKQSGRELAMAFSQRHYTEYKIAKKLLQEGAIGETLAFRTSLSNPGVEHFVCGDAEGFYDRCLENVGSVMSNVGCHRVDLVSWLFERRIERVLAFTPVLDKHFSNGEPITQADTAMVILELQGGIAGTLWTSWCNYGETDTETRIFGTLGSVRIGPDCGVVLEKADGVHMRLEAERTKAQQEGYDVVWDFLDFLAGKKAVSANGAAGLACMEVMAAIERSNASGTWEAVQ